MREYFLADGDSRRFNGESATNSPRFAGSFIQRILLCLFQLQHIRDSKDMRIMIDRRTSLPVLEKIHSNHIGKGFDDSHLRDIDRPTEHHHHPMRNHR